MHTNDNNLGKNSQQNKPNHWALEKFWLPLIVAIVGGVCVHFIINMLNQLNSFISTLVTATASGFLGLLITILLIFFDIKPTQKKHVSALTMIFILISSTLLILGVVNLHAVTNLNNEIHDSQDTDFSPKEFIEQNSDLIRQLKAEYSNEDTQIIEDKRGTAQFYICEKAGYVFHNLMKTGESAILYGKIISSVKVIIIDYLSDEIINTLTSKKDGIVRYSPENQNQFYFVAFHDEYDIYVSHPIQVVRGEADSNSSYICLEAKNSQYTPLYQFHLYMQNSDVDGQYSVVPSDYSVEVCCKNATDYQSTGPTYHPKISDSGLLLWGNKTYFSLNTDYVIGISLWHESDPNSKSVIQMFRGSIKESFQIYLYFVFSNKSDIIG